MNSPPSPCRLWLYKTTNFNAKLTNTVLLSSTLHHCSIIWRIWPASGGLVTRPPTGVFPLDPNRGLLSPRLPDEPPSQISWIRPCSNVHEAVKLVTVTLVVTRMQDGTSYQCLCRDQDHQAAVWVQMCRQTWVTWSSSPCPSCPMNLWRHCCSVNTQKHPRQMSPVTTIMLS